MSLPEKKSLNLSGERLRVLYQLSGDEQTVRRRCEEVRVEQTVEFPAQLLPAGDIRDQLLGQIDRFEQVGPARFEVTLSYPVELAGNEFVQLLNLIYGMISHQPDISLLRLELPDGLLKSYQGPRFGSAGIREALGVQQRPLISTAVKPIGLDAAELAELAYTFALGGIDIIKDDHGLANQPLSPFRERVERCSAAVARANQQTGGRSVYMPNVTGPAEQLVDRAIFAREAGAGGLMTAPGLIGLDQLRMLADDDRVNLPLLAHPTWVGSWLPLSGSGISDYALYGQLMRLAGADAVIFLGFGGRFEDSEQLSRQTVAGCRAPMGHLRKSLPMVGGGMTLERLPALLEFYGPEMIFLVGGGLHTHGPDLVANCRAFRELVEIAVKASTH